MAAAAPVTPASGYSPAPVNPLPGYGGPPPATSGRNWKVIGLVGAAVLVVVVLLAIAFGGSDSGPSREQIVADCARAGTSRSDCECVVDEYLDAGGDIDDLVVLDTEADEFDDLADFPPDLVDALVACVG
jgi:hypothetical protein